MDFLNQQSIQAQVALHDYDASTYDEIWWGLAAARDLGIQFGKFSEPHFHGDNVLER